VEAIKKTASKSHHKLHDKDIQASETIIN